MTRCEYGRYEVTQFIVVVVGGGDNIEETLATSNVRTINIRTEEVRAEYWPIKFGSIYAVAQCFIILFSLFFIFPL